MFFSPTTFFSFSLCCLQGLSVLVNGELGVVRYIGPAEFAEGKWLGVEMRKPGTIQNLIFNVKICNKLFLKMTADSSNHWEHLYQQRGKQYLFGSLSDSLSCVRVFFPVVNQSPQQLYIKSCSRERCVKK